MFGLLFDFTPYLRRSCPTATLESDSGTSQGQIQGTWVITETFSFFKDTHLAAATIGHGFGGYYAYYETSWNLFYFWLYSQHLGQCWT
jgi:hypothetical protein